MKKYLHNKIFILPIALFCFLVFPHNVFGSATYQTFIPEIILNDSCVPVVTYNLTILPSTMTSGNNFVLALNKLNTAGQSIQSADFSLNIPLNGETSGTIIASAFSGSATYRVKIVENTSNYAFVGQSDSFDLVPDSGTCTTAGGATGVDNTPTGNLSVGETMDIPIDNPISNVPSISALVQKILEGIIKIGIPLLVVMIVVSGAMYLLAMGNPAKISNAHTMLLYTLIGGAILLGAWALMKLFHTTLINLTTFVQPFLV